MLDANLKSTNVVFVIKKNFVTVLGNHNFAQLHTHK